MVASSSGGRSPQSQSQSSVSGSGSSSPFDPNPALRAELQTAFDKLDQDLRGIKDFSLIRSTPEFINFMNQQFEALLPLWEALKSALESLDAVVSAREKLAALGYPTAISISTPRAVFDQLQKEMADFEAAVELFKVAQAENIAINFGRAENKP